MKNLKLIVQYLLKPAVKAIALDGLVYGLSLLAALLVNRYVLTGASQESRALLAAATACTVNNCVWIGINGWRVLRHSKASPAA